MASERSLCYSNVDSIEARGKYHVVSKRYSSSSHGLNSFVIKRLCRSSEGLVFQTSWMSQCTQSIGGAVGQHATSSARTDRFEKEIGDGGVPGASCAPNAPRRGSLADA